MYCAHMKFLLCDAIILNIACYLWPIYIFLFHSSFLCTGCLLCSPSQPKCILFLSLLFTMFFLKSLCCYSDSIAIFIDHLCWFFILLLKYTIHLNFLAIMSLGRINLHCASIIHSACTCTTKYFDLGRHHSAGKIRCNRILRLSFCCAKV